MHLELRIELSSAARADRSVNYCNLAASWTNFMSFCAQYNLWLGKKGRGRTLQHCAAIVMMKLELHQGSSFEKKTCE